jgi:hypothetical protein
MIHFNDTRKVIPISRGPTTGIYLSPHSHIPFINTVSLARVRVAQIRGYTSNFLSDYSVSSSITTRCTGCVYYK